MNKIISIIFITLFLQGCFSTKTDTYGKVLPSGDTKSLVKTFNSNFDSLLHKYVDSKGNVDYSNWHKDQVGITTIFDSTLSKIDTTKLTGSDKMAFFINVYNILTIKGMLSHYPIKSIMDKVSRVGGFHFWKDTYVQFSNSKYSLDQIEHEILRPMKDARIHYAIVCASKSCPPLRNEVFRSKTLDSQLDDQAHRFLSSKNNFFIDEDMELIQYSTIYKWFLADFAKSESDLLNVVKPYLSSKDKALLESIEINDYSINFLPYDWSINSK
ncbi:MAG: DUF547 domain-containing protein [Candidatus Cloacimonetes bacterium]|nr:DUF547 domain-containing protein [Candidatus Cloacimonadota bacterium]